MEPVRPDYDGAWIGAVVPALLDGAAAPWLPGPVLGSDAVVLLVLDGLGWTALQEHRQALPQLAALHGGPITAAVPSTTATGLTSITTGATPARHGVVGYRMRVSGQVLNVLRWRLDDGGEAPQPAVVQPHPAFGGVPVPSVTREEFRTTGFTSTHLRGAVFHGWQTPAMLVEHCRGLVAGGARFVYAYYDGIDKVAHEHGLDERFFPAELAAADALVGALRDALPPACALVVTADHGQVGIGPEVVTRLEAVAGLVSAYAGDARFRFLHARPGAAAELLAATSECYAQCAWVFSRERLFDEGWLGDGAGLTVRGRVGDVVLAARTPTSFVDPGQPYEVRLRSGHGSLTLPEMLVPLLAGRGRGHRRARI